MTQRIINQLNKYAVKSVCAFMCVKESVYECFWYCGKNYGL